MTVGPCWARRRVRGAGAGGGGALLAQRADAEDEPHHPDGEAEVLAEVDGEVREQHVEGEEYRQLVEQENLDRAALLEELPERAHRGIIEAWQPSKAATRLPRSRSRTRTACCTASRTTRASP